MAHRRAGSASSRRRLASGARQHAAGIARSRGGRRGVHRIAGFLLSSRQLRKRCADGEALSPTTGGIHRPADEHAERWRLRYQALVEVSRQIVYEEDPATNTVDYAGDVEGILGYRPSELNGDPACWRDLVHPEDRQAFDRDHGRTRTTGAEFQLDYRVRRRDGSYAHVRDRGQALGEAAAGGSRILGCVVDLSRQHELEDQARHTQRMELVGRLASGLAHDFNNLLTIMNGYSDLVLGHLPAGDMTREMLREIKKAGRQAAVLTRQLLAFSRQPATAPQVVDLNTVIADLEKMLRRLLGEDVELITRLRPELPSVTADPGQLEQVVMTLAVAAREALPRGGRLVMETHEETRLNGTAELPAGVYVRLTVTHSGQGIGRHEAAGAVDTLVATDKDEATDSFGLAAIQEIIRQAGGHAMADRLSIGDTRIDVYLPTAPGSAQRPNSTLDLASLPRGAETLLLVEDDDAVRAFCRFVLQSRGYHLLEAANAAEAFRVCEQHGERIDLLVTDVVMPSINGRQLAEWLARRRPETKVLYVSGYTRDTVVRHGVSQNEVHLLRKPFTPAALARAVRAVLDGASPPA